MFDVYSCNALSARFFDVDRALNSYFMIMIMINQHWLLGILNCGEIQNTCCIPEKYWTFSHLDRTASIKIR